MKKQKPQKEDAFHQGNAEKRAREEKRILSSFISELPEGIIVCSAEGRILLYNRMAARLLLSGTGTGEEYPVLTGRLITSLLDKAPVEHALDEISRRLKRNVLDTVSYFTLQRPNRTIQVRIVPVLSVSGNFAGFVLILDDITLQNRAEERVTSLLKTLTKDARSPLASIRAAIEAMRQFPQMQANRREQFEEIIRNEAVVLTDILDTVSERYESLIRTERPLEPVPAPEIVDALFRRSREQLGIVLDTGEPSTGTPGEKPLVNADRFSIITALLFILNQLKTHTGLWEFSLRVSETGDIVHIDILWQGASLAPETVKEWENLILPGQHHGTALTLKEVTGRHHAAWFPYTGKGPDDSECLRLFLPAVQIPVRAASSVPDLISEPRFEHRDLSLFSRPDMDRELDSRLLTELAFTSLVREVTRAKTLEELIDKHDRLPGLISSMLSGGTKIKTVTFLVTTFSDALLAKIMELALEKAGRPPVPFSFMTLGSEGRKEQTLKTDQDNAIIFQDVPQTEEEKIQAYFLDLADTVCTWLDRAGYNFCRGGIMAKNEKWCRPVSAWKKYMSSWIHEAGPEDLFHTNIFFDFRHGAGDPAFVEELRGHLFDRLEEWTGFLRHMTQNAVYFKPPLGAFGRLITSRKKEHRNHLDIKLSMMPIVEFARIYALRHRIRETNTESRLYRLYLKNVLSERQYNEIEQAYSFMMQLRFTAQINAIVRKGKKPDNYVNPKELSSFEKKMLKEVLKTTGRLQDRLSFDFTGSTSEPLQRNF